ncbi:MAG: sensor histidine kinase [Haliscomenobacter sp.]|uniref:tetratricopeptide repeat-containing sensor histidine kinase n=1 Tax=Haliscomenobacter sp. TaxID=2717303 RepID=UPI0029A71033|nr:sensor histidine kinase [Haliscomenobacter sp.]MDX2069171.1 sensor histidine kinase [Haliscomenobacter sp.]
MRPEARTNMLLYALLLAVLPNLCPVLALSTPELLKKAQYYLEQDQPDSAQLFFARALQQAQQKKQHQLQLTAGMGLATSYFYQDDYDRCRDQLEACANWAEEQSDLPRLLEIWLSQGHLNMIEGNWPEAKGILLKLEKKADPSRHQTTLAAACNYLAKLYSAQNQLDKANFYLKKGKTLAQQLPDKTLEIDFLTQLATNYKNQDGALLQAQTYLEELIQLRKKTQDKHNLIADYQELAELLQQKGDYPEAQEQRLKALTLAVSIRDSLQQMELLHSLGLAYRQQNQLQSSNAYLNRALNLALVKNNSFKAAEIQRCLGENQAKVGKRAEAQQWYQKARQGFFSIGNDLEMGRTLVLFQQTDSSRKALTYFNKELQSKINNGEILGEVETRLDMARIQIDLRDATGALRSLQPCVVLAQTAGSREQLLAVWDNLARAHALQGNFKAAYTFSKRHQHLKDSIFNLEQTRTISEMNARFDNAALRDSLQQAEIARNRAELRQKNLLNYLLGGTLLAGALIAFLLFQNYRSSVEKRVQAERMAALEKQREADQLRSMINGEEQERKRIAQELHDGLGTLLATVKLQFNAVQNERPDIDTVKSYQKADNLLDEACTEVRKISYNLLPAILQQYGLEYALQDLCEGINRSGRLEVSFIPYGLDYTFDDQTAVSVYRIVQELVKNTLRHAEASELIVQLSVEDEVLNIVVEDDGQGFDPAEKLKKPGIGLQSIQSRLALLGGKMEVESSPQAGSTFTIDIPLVVGQK